MPSGHIRLHNIRSQVRFNAATAVTVEDRSNIHELIHILKIALGLSVCTALQSFLYILGLKHPCDKPQCIFAVATVARRNTCLPSDVMRKPVMPISKNYGGFFFERGRAAASSFSICEMYMFNAGLCCSAVMELTRGQGYESHCGFPL